MMAALVDVLTSEQVEDLDWELVEEREGILRLDDGSERMARGAEAEEDLEDEARPLQVLGQGEVEGLPHHRLDANFRLFQLPADHNMEVGWRRDARM